MRFGEYITFVDVKITGLQKLLKFVSPPTGNKDQHDAPIFANDAASIAGGIRQEPAQCFQNARCCQVSLSLVDYCICNY
jgi:hypothetical protein